MFSDNFTKNYKLYIMYYILMYIFVVAGYKPEPGVELWKFYFPVKSLPLFLAIELANMHDVIFRTAFYAEEFDYRRLFIVGGTAFFYNVFLCLLFIYVMKNFTGIDLWYIFL